MVRIGVHYEYPFGGMATRPEWLPKGASDWRRDLAKIRETGFNSIRIRIGMDSNLDEVAELLDLAHESGLTVVFGTALFYVNDAFVEEHPDSKIVGGTGEVCPVDRYDLRWQRACIDHPGYRAMRNEVLDACASRFAGHPAIIAWDVHNEPSVGPLENACFCDHTLAKYRAALEREFGDVAALNCRFGTDFPSFAAVRPPKTRDAANEERYLHWREFMTSNLSDFLLEGRDIVRRSVPDSLVTHNVTHHFTMNRSGQDWWLFRDYNLLTMSKYIGTTELSVASSTGYEMLRAMSPDRPRWVTEFQGGPFPTLGGGGLNRLYSGREAEIEMNAVFAHGMRGLYFYRWTPLMCGAEPWINGMVEPDTYDTDRRMGIQRAIADLEPHLELIDRATSLAASVGIYQSRSQVMRSGREKARASYLERSIAGAYALLSDAGYEAAFLVHGVEELDAYPAVVVPYTRDLSGGEIDAIVGYVSRGGTAIVDLSPDADEENTTLANAFGCTIVGHDRLTYLLNSGWSTRGTGNGLALENGAFGGYCFDERLTLAGDDSVLVYDDTRATAAVVPPGPAGRVLVSGARLFYSYGVSLHMRIRQIVAAFIAEAVAPDITLDGADEEFRPYLEARVLQDPESGDGLLFVMNRSPHKSYALRVTVKGYEPVDVQASAYGVTRHLITRTV